MEEAQANGNAIMLQDGLGRPPFSGINLQEAELRFEGFIDEVALVPKPSAEVLVGPLKIVNFVSLQVPRSPSTSFCCEGIAVEVKAQHRRRAYCPGTPWHLLRSVASWT